MKIPTEQGIDQLRAELQLELNVYRDVTKLLKDTLQLLISLGKNPADLVSINANTRTTGMTVELLANPEPSELLCDLTSALRALKPHLLVVKDTLQ